MPYLKYTKSLLEPIVKESTSVAEVARKLGKSPVGGTVTLLRRNIDRFGLCTKHFSGHCHRKGKPSPKKLLPEQVLIYDNSEFPRRKGNRVKQALLETGVEYICALCSVPNSWNSKPLTLQLDHIDGKYWNNEKENLRFLCPNCHSQTETFCRKNKAPVVKR